MADMLPRLHPQAKHLSYLGSFAPGARTGGTVCGLKIQVTTQGLRYTTKMDETVTCEDCVAQAVHDQLEHGDRESLSAATAAQLDSLAAQVGVTRRPAEPDIVFRQRIKGVVKP